MLFDAATLPDTNVTFSVANLVTLVGIGLTFLVGFINIVLSIRKSSLEGVTANRVKWISEVKTYAASIMAYSFYDLRTVDEIKTANEKLIINANLLNLNLNILGPFDSVIAEYLKNVVDSRKQDLTGAKEDDFIRYKRLLNLSLQIYLKTEWNRVKKSYKVWPCSIHLEKRSITKIINGFGNQDNSIQQIQTDYKRYLKAKKDKVVKSKTFSEIISAKVHSSVMTSSNVTMSSSVRNPDEDDHS